MEKYGAVDLQNKNTTGFSKKNSTVIFRYR
jgi:hypothetical protein